MSISWYYVQGNSKVGPIEEKILLELINTKKLTEESYVWKKGFVNWIKIKDVDFLRAHAEQEAVEKNNETDLLNLSENIQQNNSLEEVQQIKEETKKVAIVNWETITEDQRVFVLKQKESGNIFGPFSIQMLRRLAEDERMNEESLIFYPKMSYWTKMSHVPICGKIISKVFNPDKNHQQKLIPGPVVAQININNKIIEGVCRDLTIGGTQVLFADCPFEMDEKISINLVLNHTQYKFSLKGKVGRVLEGNQGIFVIFLNVNIEMQKGISQFLG